MENFSNIDSKYQSYISELIKWNSKVNLISKNTEQDILSRHIKDSEQLCKYIKDKNASIVDLGSGAGFPGMVLAINQYTNLTLIESDKKKCAFLETMKKKLSLSVTIVNQRIENFKSEAFNIITARGFASIKKIIEISDKLADKNSRFLLLKGVNWQKEIEELEKNYSFKYLAQDSDSKDEAKILEIWEVRKVK